MKKPNLLVLARPRRRPRGTPFPYTVCGYERLTLDPKRTAVQTGFGRSNSAANEHETTYGYAGGDRRALNCVSAPHATAERASEWPQAPGGERLYGPRVFSVSRGLAAALGVSYGIRTVCPQRDVERRRFSANGWSECGVLGSAVAAGGGLARFSAADLARGHGWGRGRRRLGACRLVPWAWVAVGAS